MYLHVATNPVANLPTTEQSTNTSVYSLNPVSTNFFMDDQIGTAQVTRPTSGTAPATGKTFIGRWVSPVLDTTTQVDANTWTVNFACTDAGSGRFPSNTTPGPIWICAYVWRPGTGKVGTIIDGNSASAFQLGTTVEKVEHGTFTGAQVTGVQSTDVICVELWGDTTGAGGGWQYRVYFDGTVENTTPAATVSDHAAFVETPQTLGGFPTRISRSLTTESVSISDGLDRLATHGQLITESIPISEALKGYYARLPGIISITDAVDKLVTSSGNNVVKTMPTETIAISTSLARLAAKSRVLITEVITIADSLARLSAKIKALATETVANAELIARLVAKKRTLTESTNLTDDLTRLANKFRVLSETIANSELLTRLKPITKALPTESITSSESLSRLVSEFRTLSEAVVSSESISRLLAKYRLLTETQSILDTTTKLKTVQKVLTETGIAISSALDRLKESLRTSIDTITLTSSLARLLTNVRLSTESISISDAIDIRTQAAAEVIRTLIESVSVTDSLDRLATKFRILSTQVINTVDSLARLSARVKTSTDSISVSQGTLTKLLAKVRTSNDLIVIQTSLTRLTSKFRVLSDTVTKGESLTRLLTRIKPLTLETVTISESISRLLAKIRTRTESVSVSELVNILAAVQARHIVRIIEEIDTAIGDFFYKFRRPAIETIDITDSIDIEVVNNLHIPIHVTEELDTESSQIYDEVTLFKPIREVVLTLSDSISTGDTTANSSGKTRRIGGVDDQ